MNKECIKHDLERLAIGKGETVFFHSSLKSIGYVEGGAETVIDAFLEVIGEHGTLVLPALCKYDWDNMSRQDIENAWEIHSTPTFTGLIPETMRKRTASLRSDNPTHSVSAMGHHAVEITRDHRRAHGGEHAPDRPKWFSKGALGENSPWDKLYQLNAKYLLLGVDFGRCTMLHHVQVLLLERHLTKLNPNASWPTFSFPKMGDALEKRGIVGVGNIGNATTRLIGCKALVDTALDLLVEHGCEAYRQR